MSSSQLLKAELKARRSSRELEHSLDHLGVKLEKGAEKAQELKARANEVLTKIKHPRATLSKFASDCSHLVMASVRDSMDRIPEERWPLLVSLAAGSYILGLYLMGRRKRRLAQEKVIVVPADQVRIFIEAA